MSQQTIVLPKRSDYKSAVNHLVRTFKAGGYKSSMENHKEVKLIDYSSILVTREAGFISATGGTTNMTIPVTFIRLYTYTYPKYHNIYRTINQEAKSYESAFYDERIEEKLGGIEEKLGV